VAVRPRLRRAIERLRSDSDADVSLAALTFDAGLSRFRFCCAFKESTGHYRTPGCVIEEVVLWTDAPASDTMAPVES
jgi:hypothetical protein